MPRISERRREGRRAEILAAAETCFARLGFHRASMRDVIAESGLSAGCVYTHFSSKDDLVAAIAEDRHAVEATMLREGGAGDDAPRALRALARAFVGPLETRRGVAARRLAVQTWAEALLDARILERVVAGVSLPIARVAEIVAEGQRAGQVRKEVDASVLARVLVASFHGVVLQKLWQPELSTEALLRAFDVLVDGLTVTRGAAAGTPPSAPAPKRRRRT